MKSQWIRYAVVALFACGLGVLAHASISRAVQAQNAAAPAEAAPGFPGLEARLAAQQSGQKAPSNKELHNPLLQKLWDVIDQADEVSSEEKSDARAILEEADPILTRIKKENQRAIEIVKNPPRRILPKPAPPAEKTPPAEKPAEKAPAEKVPAEKTPAAPEAKK